MFESKYEFVEVITHEGIMIEVRDRTTNKVVSRMEPDLFEYMLERAWSEDGDAQNQEPQDVQPEQEKR